MAVKFDDVVKRLKALAEVESREAFEAGKVAGLAWAYTASRKQLRRLDKAVREGGGADAYLDQDGSSNQTVAERVADDIDVEWESVLDEGCQDFLEVSGFLLGFVTSSIEAWDAAESQR